MSFYDDASLVFLPSGGAGKDTKAYSIKPRDGSGDFTFSRGSNLTATRVDSNGLIEKGRENLLINSVWDGVTTDTRPTGWTSQFVSGTGTFDVTATEGQIRFQTLDASSRAFIYSPTIATNGIVVASVYVDEVTTAMPLSDLLSRSGSATFLFAYEDGVEINYSDNVQAGKRYSVIFNKTASTTFRFGVGTSSGTLGDVVLSRPQIEIGLVATEYITSPIGSTGKAGILEDSPRFDYSGGASCPSLLLEPSRTNLIAYSEYFEGGNWSLAGNATLQLRTSITAPDGSNAVYLVSGDGETTTGRVQYNSSTSTDDQVYSVFIKGVSGIATRARLQNSSSSSFLVVDIDSSGNVSFNSQTAHDNYYGIEDYGNGWYRLYLRTTTDGGNQLFRVYPDILDGDGSVYVWGAQIEVQQHVTSYIPNHSGSSVTRAVDTYRNNDIDAVTNMSTDECTVLLDVDLPQGREGSTRFIQFVDAAGGGTTLWGFKGVYVPAPIIQLHAQGTITTSSTHSLSVGRHKIAVRWLSGTATVYIDGAEVSALSTTDSAAPTNFDQVSGSGAGYRHFVHELIVFESSLDNADLEILTGTSYGSFAAMATALNYTTYE